jgi:hypothetical protein
MILETIVTTRNRDGTVNIAPMGPYCDDPELATFELRPFCTSTTWQNLKRSRQGILHITDNVELFARAATGGVVEPTCLPGLMVNVERLADFCRCYEFQVTWLQEARDRATVHCRTLHAERQRDFIGFHRARHAVIEACILATRVDFLPPQEIRRQFAELERLVIKTGGPAERAAFQVLLDFLPQAVDNDSDTTERPPA